MVKRAQKSGLAIKRYFTKDVVESGKDVYDSTEWEKSDVEITDEYGKKLFTQKDVEFPKDWSQLARKIVASRYFYGEYGKLERESSVKQLIDRVSKTFPEWALKQRYFDSEGDAKIFEDELAYLSLHQKMAFNSPVWFNCGINEYTLESKKKEKKEGYIIRDGKVVTLPLGKENEFPQTSACFIQGLEDTMESIMQLAYYEAMLFKYGSGTGSNLSPLRSSKEKLSGGGKPSGPLAYNLFYDKVAGIVKSGGKTRRAAKHNCLNDQHPDIMEFIKAKAKEQEKIEIMIAAGIDPREAVETVGYQNVNLSVRASDEFMNAVERDEEWQTIPIHNKELIDQMPKYKARGELLEKIAKGTWKCGDPGMQFDTTINDWHTCPNSERINASNPCSEYMFIDNSACNLASHNLMMYVDEEGNFLTEQFSEAVRLTAIAQDLEIDNSCYPRKEIAKNAHIFRPLGMGYANLGSLLMFLGLPYNSDEARAIAGAITALMTAKVYDTSSEMAKKLGTFKEFEKNKESMLRVMRKHRDALKGIEREKLPGGLEKVLDEAEKTWDRVVKKGERYGFRNAQATLLAPTGTIGFMMDCDTKGIEPEIGLVQTKLLSEGGTLRLVNETVQPALQKLGYSEKQIKEIRKYILENETIEGAPHIKEEHLAIFDCSNKPKKGKRTISPEGHLKMMAAVQPFLSGAISKTVNLPTEITAKQIEQIYIDAWKMGLKAVSLYRDGSKRLQPLSFENRNLEEKLEPVRRKLPITRDSITHKFNVAGHEGYLTVGLYINGQPGEIFITMSKEGSTIGGLMDSFATALSIGLQYGVPLDSFIKKFKDQRFEPRGLVYEDDLGIKQATSLVDYIGEWLERRFLKKEKPDKIYEIEMKVKRGGVEEIIDDNEEKINNNEKTILTIDDEKTGFCAVCGTKMTRRGHCLEECSNPKCGWQDPRGCGE